MKKLNGIFSSVVLTSVLVLAGCSNNSGSSEAANVSSTEETTIKIGSFGSDLDIWTYISELEATKEAGINIELVNVDGIDINTATSAGDMDYNAFQTYDYMKVFNDDHEEDVVPAFTTYIEPLGIYSNEFDTLDDVPEASQVAIANNPAQQSRSLALLQDANFITLNEEVEGLYTVKDITENPKKLEFIEIDDNSGLQALEDVALVTISSTLAFEGGLNPKEDALFTEDTSNITDSNIGNVNVFVTSDDNENSEQIETLQEIYFSDDVKNYIETEFNDTKVPVDLDLATFESEGE